MHAAVVEFDPLPDPVRAAAQYHDLAPIARLRFALFFISRVQIGGEGREFPGTGVDPLVDRADALLMALPAHLVFAGLEQLGQAAIREALALEPAHLGRVDLRQRHSVETHFLVHDVLDLHQKPGIDVGQAVYLGEREAVLERIADIPDALRAGFAEFFLDFMAVGGLLIQAINPDFEPAQGFLETLLEGPADRHHFADRLHLRGQMRIGLLEFLECETRHLGDHIVDRRLE